MIGGEPGAAVLPRVPETGQTGLGELTLELPGRCEVATGTRLRVFGEELAAALS